MKEAKECAFVECKELAIHTIDNATIFPKFWNGKRICKYHKELRELLMQEPECDKV